MLRLVMGTTVGALLVAPLGFGELTPAVVAGPARMLFVLLSGTTVALLALGVFWNRRWPV